MNGELTRTLVGNLPRDSFVPSRTVSFLHIHNKQIKHLAPTWMRIPNMRSILHKKLKNYWQHYQMNTRSKPCGWVTIKHKQYCIRIKHIWLYHHDGNKKFVLPHQLRVLRQSLVRNTPLWRYQRKNLILGTFIAWNNMTIKLAHQHAFTSTRYMESTHNFHLHVDSMEIHVLVIIGQLPTILPRHSMPQNEAN
jgi:hypothetical protein